MKLISILAALLLSAALLSTLPADRTDPVLELIAQDPQPLVTIRHPDAAGNKYGFEGGRAVKIGSHYHLFTSEMVADPIWVKMKFGHWTSADGALWKRVSTVFESSGEFQGKDPRASLWSPLPVWDDGDGRWNLFYVAYRSKPSTPNQFLLNYGAQIWRAVSTTPGMEGIGGPYRDVSVVMQPGPDSQPWEGLQGTDSFFPYSVGKQWYALYGSAKTETLPIQSWQVGLAKGAAVGGPWKRVPAGNPVPIEKVFIENPIVTPVPQGGYMCVYDCNTDDAIGYAYSADGIHWNPGHALVVQPRHSAWSHDVRTPLGLIPEGGNDYTIYYTGFEQHPNWPELLAGKGSGSCAIGRVKVRLQ